MIRENPHLFVVRDAILVPDDIAEDAELAEHLLQLGLLPARPDHVVGRGGRVNPK